MNKKILGIIIALIMLTALSPVYAQPTCTRVATYGGSFYNCTIEFVVGWNLISLPVVPFTGTQFSRTFNNTVKGIFGSDGLAQGTVVETYANGLWRVCAALTAGTCSGSLRNMVDGNGYWVYAPAILTIGSASATVPGTVYGSVIAPGGSPPSYALVKGWNLVGYKPQPLPTASTTAVLYLASLVDGTTYHYDVNNVWILNNAAGTWTRLDSAPITPTQAMWIFTDATGLTLIP